MVTLKSPRSPRSVVAQAATMSPDALNPASPSRDINAIVEDAAKRFDDMDNDLKCLMQDMKNYQNSMAQLNENRLKTARHLESFAVQSPFEDFVSPSVLESPLTQAVVGTEIPADSGSVGTRSSAASDEAAARDVEKATIEKEENESEATETEDKKSAATIETNEKKPAATSETEDTKPAVTSETGEKKKPAAATETKEKEEEADSDAKPAATEDQKTETEDTKPKADVESFAGVHQSAYNLSKKYHEQYGQYIISYVENWERVISQRIHGLLIHYRELQDHATHYNKKVGGLLHKVDKSKNVRHKLAEKLDRNEIKEMGAVEARDTVGEHLYLYIEEVMERAWRDVFPLLLRTCRFEADFSSAQAKVLANLVVVAENIQVIGEDEECDVMGRLDNLQKKHPEEVFTEENPFVKLTPRKKNLKQPDLSDNEEGETMTDDVHPQSDKMEV